jgi:hypothetical protein
VRLHVVTAITRPANLAAIADSLAAACCTSRVDLVWHWRFDWQREHVGGQKLKNDALDDIRDGWVWMLDDDTIAHSEILQAWAQHARHEGVGAVVFGQSRADGRILVANEQNVRVGHIDIGQAFLRRDIIGEHRLPEHYDGDGMFLEAVLPSCETIYDNRLLSFHNRLEAA